jgi:RNA recognition motif-containing protein
MNIFVGNLSRNVIDTELRAAFEQYGTVKSAVIIYERETGQSKGFGFVEMDDNNEANAAIAAMNGFEMKGRKLNVNEARPRDERPKRDGFQKRRFNR